MDYTEKPHSAPIINYLQLRNEESIRKSIEKAPKLGVRVSLDRLSALPIVPVERSVVPWWSELIRGTKAVLFTFTLDREI